MSRVLARWSRLVTARPYVTLLALVVVTVVLAAGAGRRAPVVEGAALAFLPPDHAVANAIRDIDEFFGESSDVGVVTLLFRGEGLTPEGLSQMDALIDRLVRDPGVGGLLAHGDPVVSPALLLAAVIQTDGFESATQAEIDAARGTAGIGDALEAMTGTDTDGTPVAIATIRLINTGDERVKDTERRINELAAADSGPLRVSSISPAVIEDEYKKATEEGMAPLIGLALLLIAVLILVFLRTLSDLSLTLLGLLFSLIWVIGAEGWLGPNALGLIGAPSTLTALVPIIVISLTVDYAIQTVSHYREQRAAGDAVAAAARTGLQRVTVPLLLAAGTTIASLLVNLLSPIGLMGDFGIVAGLGVAMSLTVMLTLLPAGRAIIDRRREARGTLAQPRPVADALPGIGRMAEVLGTSVARRPAPYFAIVIAVTIGLGSAIPGIESGFNIREILPRGGSVLEDMETLDATVGGSTEMASVLVAAEATGTRTLLNLHDLRTAFEDERRRPPAAAGPILVSYELLVNDWTEKSGAPGDSYDPELAALFGEATEGLQLDPALMQEFLDRLKTLEPTLARSLVDDPGGIDALLVQFPTYAGDPEVTRALQEDIEGLWFGDDGAVTATSLGIVGVSITDEIISQQTRAITTTIAVALGLLAVFFWVTLRQPLLAIVAVGPIVLVLIWVLGTMALLNIRYTLITSIITALSIGIGVDYTIHLIHRYREEFTRVRDPEQAAVRTLATTGSALLGSALTTALGLGVLVASPLLASQQFGITAAITIVYSLVVSMLVVPPAMTVWGAYQNMRLRSMVQRWADELDEVIEQVHRHHEQERPSS